MFDIITNRFGLFKQARPIGAKIFDFGCGSGFFVGELQKKGYDAVGMDFETEAIDYGLKSGIKNLLVGKGDKIEFADESFDVVMGLDVLEHLKDEKHVIKELVRILKPGGKMIITVPAYMWLWGLQDEVSHHFRRYTLKNLSDLFLDFDSLSVIKKTYFNTLLFPLVVMVRLASRWFNAKDRESDFDINSPVLNKLLYLIFNVEKYLVKFISLPFGSSILIILQKK